MRRIGTPLDHRGANSVRTTRLVRVGLLAVALALLASMWTPASARIVPARHQWTGAAGTGVWEDAGNWDCLCVPDDFADAIIPAGAIPITVNSDIELSFFELGDPNTVTVAAGRLTVTTTDIDGTLVVADGQSLRAEGSPWLVDGTIELASNGAFTVWDIGPAFFSVQGAGTIHLHDPAPAAPAASIVGVDGDEQFELDGPTITGAGFVGAGTLRVVNRSLISAGPGVLTIEPNLDGVVNRGTLLGGVGALRIRGAEVNNDTPGIIRADGTLGAGRVHLDGTSTRFGGTVEVLGDGELRLTDADVDSTPIINSPTGKVRIVEFGGIAGLVNPAGGIVVVADTAILYSNQPIDNDGLIALKGTTEGAGLWLEGAAELRGGGTVSMSNATGNFVDADFGVNHNTIEGAGSIRGTSLSNLGAIRASQPHHLVLDTHVTSSGRIEVEAGRRLSLSTGPAEIDVVGGVLQVDGVLESPSDVIQVSDATIGGIGRIYSPALNAQSSVIAPGSSTGRLEVSGPFLAFDGSAFDIEIAGNRAYDRLVVNGDTDLALSTLAVDVSYTPPMGRQFKIVSVRQGGMLNGTFASLPEGASFTAGGFTFQITYSGGDGNDVVLTRVA